MASSNPVTARFRWNHKISADIDSGNAHIAGAPVDNRNRLWCAGAIHGVIAEVYFGRRQVKWRADSTKEYLLHRCRVGVANQDRSYSFAGSSRLEPRRD